MHLKLREKQKKTSNGTRNSDDKRLVLIIRELIMTNFPYFGFKQCDLIVPPVHIKGSLAIHHQ